jgi:hypothetical protein
MRFVCFADEFLPLLIFAERLSANQELTFYVYMIPES